MCCLAGQLVSTENFVSADRLVLAELLLPAPVAASVRRIGDDHDPNPARLRRQHLHAELVADVRKLCNTNSDASRSHPPLGPSADAVDGDERSGTEDDGHSRTG